MNATSITLRNEVSKLRQAIVQKPDAKLGSLTTELADYMTVELEVLTFSDGAIYFHGIEFDLQDDLPCHWLLK